MSRKVLNRKQVRQEIQHSLQPDLPALMAAGEVEVPMPKPHSLDVHACNRDMKERAPPECGATLRKVVEEARKAFFLSDPRSAMRSPANRSRMVKACYE